ncbi:hypothetical protein AO057_15310 [Curvibacter sp. PAE-UM]|nr:hypothetical protein AO057_15310 [Curvibacter sp. PAE-UM]
MSISKTVADNKTTDQQDRENQAIIEARLKEELDFCQPRLSGFERKSAEQAENAYWLSMSGLVAGTVLAPALTAANAAGNAAGIAALSGWAGATNFAGQSLKTSGLSGSAIAETRKEITKNIKDQIVIAFDGSKKFEERSAAIMKIRAECIVYEIAVPSIPQQN